MPNPTFVPLQYPPKTGDILMCEFPACFGAPEMVKTRAVVVISRNIQHAKGLATVVPLSNTAPAVELAHHCKIPVKFLSKWHQATGGDRWLKGDMVYTLSTKRLRLIETARDKSTGKRSYERLRLDGEHLNMVRACVAAALNIDASLFPGS